jgi:hypothetical protein
MEFSSSVTGFLVKEPEPELTIAGTGELESLKKAGLLFQGGRWVSCAR